MAAEGLWGCENSRCDGGIFLFILNIFPEFCIFSGKFECVSALMDSNYNQIPGGGRVKGTSLNGKQILISIPLTGGI